MTTEQTPAELTEQTNEAFRACNTADGFRVPDGMRLEMLWPGAAEWRVARVTDGDAWIAGADYRLVPERVPLGPEDVPPGSVFRHRGVTAGWMSVEWIADDGSRLRMSGQTRTFSGLMADDLEINRSLPLTGRWDATAWEPCGNPAAPTAVPEWPGEGYRLLVEGERRRRTDEYLTTDRRVVEICLPDGLVGPGDLPVRRRMPDVCPFTPGQVLSTITDLEDARYWQSHGVSFDLRADQRDTWSDSRDTDCEFTRQPLCYRRSP